MNHRSNLVKLEMEARYDDRYQNVFNARLLLPFIDFMVLITIIPKLLLHTFDLNEDNFWILSETVTLFSFVLMKSVTEERWALFASLIQCIPAKNSELEATFPEKLLNYLKTNKETIRMLEKARGKDVFKLFDEAQKVITTLPQKHQIMLTRAVFQAYAGRRIHMLHFDLHNDKTKKKTASLISCDGFKIVEGKHGFYEIEWINQAKPQLSSQCTDLAQDQMRCATDANEGINLDVLIPNASCPDNQEADTFLEDYHANSAFYDSIKDYQDDYDQKVSLETYRPPAKSLKVDKTANKSINLSAQKTAGIPSKRLVTSCQSDQEEGNNQPPHPPLQSGLWGAGRQPQQLFPQLPQFQHQQQPMVTQNQQPTFYQPPNAAQQLFPQQPYPAGAGVPGPPQPQLMSSIPTHYHPFRQPQPASLYPSPMYTAHVQPNNGYSPWPQSIMTPVQQSAVSSNQIYPFILEISIMKSTIRFNHNHFN